MTNNRPELTHEQKLELSTLIAGKNKAWKDKDYQLAGSFREREVAITGEWGTYREGAKNRKKFSPVLYRIISERCGIVANSKYDTIPIELVLCDILKEEKASALKLIRSLNVDIAALLKALEHSEPLTENSQAITMLKLSFLEAKLFGNEISSTHLLLSILKTNSSVAKSLNRFQITYESVLLKIQENMEAISE